MKKAITFVIIAGIAWIILLSILSICVKRHEYQRDQRLQHEKLNFTLLNVLFEKNRIQYRDSYDSAIKYINRGNLKGALKFKLNAEYYLEELRTVKHQQDSIYLIIEKL